MKSHIFYVYYVVKAWHMVMYFIYKRRNIKWLDLPVSSIYITNMDVMFMKTFLFIFFIFFCHGADCNYNVGQYNLACWRPMMTSSSINLKINSCHDANIVITGVTRGCQNDNLWCHLWWQSWHHENPSKLASWKPIKVGIMKSSEYDTYILYSSGSVRTHIKFEMQKGPNTWPLKMSYGTAVVNIISKKKKKKEW